MFFFLENPITKIGQNQAVDKYFSELVMYTILRPFYFFVTFDLRRKENEKVKIGKFTKVYIYIYI